MNNIINKIASNIPESWIRIPREEYSLRKVYVSDEYQIVDAYEVDGRLLVFNYYPDEEEFIEAYDEQINEIKEVIKGKDWKGISVIKPIKNKYLINADGEKLYICAFETYNNDERISIQIFYEKDSIIIGFSTYVEKEKGRNIDNIIKQTPLIHDIFNFFKKEA